MQSNWNISINKKISYIAIWFLCIFATLAVLLTILLIADVISIPWWIIPITLVFPYMGVGLASVFTLLFAFIQKFSLNLWEKLRK